MTSNLPNTISDSKTIKTFFDNINNTPISFPSGQIDAVVGFFMKRGFDSVGANSVAIVLLKQAHREHVNVFKLLDTLKNLTDIQLSQVVTQVLNSTRDKTSLLGYRTAPVTNTYEARNILV
jgi:hypothetical protein